MVTVRVPAGEALMHSFVMDPSSTLRYGRGDMKLVRQEKNR